MLNRNECITLKQILYLFIGKGIKVCEVWERADFYRHQFYTEGSGKYKMSLQATALLDNGYEHRAVRANVLAGNNRAIEKAFKEIDKKPFLNGTVEELSNLVEYYELMVEDIVLVGVLKRKLIIVLSDK